MFTLAETKEIEEMFSNGIEILKEEEYKVRGLRLYGF